MGCRIGLGIWSIQVLLDSYHTEYCHILLTEYQHYQNITVSKILGKTLLTGSHWGIPWNHLLLWDYCLWSLSGWLLQNPLLLGLLFGFFHPSGIGSYAPHIGIFHTCDYWRSSKEFLPKYWVLPSTFLEELRAYVFNFFDVFLFAWLAEIFISRVTIVISVRLGPYFLLEYLYFRHKILCEDNQIINNGLLWIIVYPLPLFGDIVELVKGGVPKLQDDIIGAFLS